MRTRESLGGSVARSASKGRREFRDEDVRDAGSDVADRGHTASTAPSTVDVPPAYENIGDTRPLRS